MTDPLTPEEEATLRECAVTPLDPDPLTVIDPWYDHIAASTALEPVRYAALLGCVVALLPAAVVCLWVLERIHAIVRRVTG